MQETVGILTDVLKRDGLLTGDDEKAFSHSVHYGLKRTASRLPNQNNNSI
jgi:hypothetical protein